MTNWQTILTSDKLRYLNHTENNFSAWESFAIDDALAESVNAGHSAEIIRLWRHQDTVVLGIADTRLPYLAEAAKWLLDQGYQPVVRNSGGLAVVADQGVLNISLLLRDGQKTSIHQGYADMVTFVRALFANWTDQIEAFEVVGSYCPGDYDLSIGGQKFAGISQRRVRNGIAVQIYLAIEEDQQQRAKLIKEFYQIGIQGKSTRFIYPNVDPDTMAALATLLNVQLTVEDVINEINRHLTTHELTLDKTALQKDELASYQIRRQQMIERNKKALGALFTE
ncbi:octanoyl-[GcvH]:protein N-octanoyltransferase [Amphibacillus marinus]|uniref:Octanoyl-[GcvH]:protein N-octanoyltransferase n=2 Tax=Amphibacillus marinus TaxID=872970 RepID=A0A1H8MYK9_9BACI|nr:octanoyl-[GcvH]:protein N-octanoyltransferase [Amphibacillus marinus]